MGKNQPQKLPGSPLNPSKSPVTLPNLPNGSLPANTPLPPPFTKPTGPTKQ